MARIYATTSQYEAFTGQAPAPDGTDVFLARASRMLDSRVLRLCWYEVDEAGVPTSEVVAAAVADAVCAQAEWWIAVGDAVGADGVGWGSVSIGSVSLSRGSGGNSGEDSAARQVAPAVWDALRSPDLTPEVFRLGEVMQC